MPRQYLFEEIAPQFAAGVQVEDAIVAGKNFGCGSAMEAAVTAVLGAGIRAVLAGAFVEAARATAIMASKIRFAVWLEPGCGGVRSGTLCAAAPAAVANIMTSAGKNRLMPPRP